MQQPDSTDIKDLLSGLTAGNSAAAQQLLPLVYDELKQLARKQMSNERVDHTLQPTALVHEAYLRLVGKEDMRWEDRTHFLFAASQAMRRILVEHARSRENLKRGGGRRRLPSSGIDLESAEQCSEILALDEALSRLESMAPDVGRVVRLRFFGGLTIEQTAEVLQISPRTVIREWTFARAWLSRELGNDS